MAKFVFFGRSNFQYNGFDSMKILLNDVINDEDFYYVEPLDSLSYRLLNFFYNSRIGTSIKKRFKLPFREKMFEQYMEHSKCFEENDRIFFIFVRYESWFFENDGFLVYLKKKYANCKLVYLLINVNRYLRIDFEKFCPYFDKVLTIDEGDAAKYGLEFHPFFYSPIANENLSIPESDCFYVGNAKERLDEIIEIYELFTRSGLKCDFHIVNVPEEKQRHKNQISYNNPLNYDDVVCHIKRTRMLLEIMQEGQTSGTLREHEAIIYNKKLITNNAYIKNRFFYNPNNISVFDEPKNIDLNFINSSELIVEYNNKELLSPKMFLDFLDCNL